MVSAEVLDAWARLHPGDRDLGYLPASQGETGRRLRRQHEQLAVFLRKPP